MEKILVVEDNKDVNAMLCEVLSGNGYQVQAAFTGTEGLQKIMSGEFDLMLLDLMLPYKSGDEVLRELRLSSDLPVIIISAKDMVGTKIDLLKLGADDYVTKPFDLNEVVARVETNLRRFQKKENKSKQYTYKDMCLEDEGKRIFVNQKELDLTGKEYQILELLIKNRSKVFSKANIYETVWENTYIGDDNAVKTHMSNLRTKLKQANGEQEYIETVWGMGYRLFKE